MAQGFEIVSVQVTLTYYDFVPNPGMRQTIQARARGTYLPPKEFPLPNGTTAFALQAERGESNIVINTNDLTMVHSVPKSMSKSSEKVLALALEDIPLVHNLLDDIGVADQIIYVGVALSSRIALDTDDEILKQLYLYLQAPVPEKLIDTMVRRTYEFEDGKYTNVTVQNYRNFSRNNVVDPSLIRMNNDDATERGIEFLIDHNTRLSYNRGDNVDVSIASTKALIREAIRHAIITGKAISGEQEK